MDGPRVNEASALSLIEKIAVIGNHGRGFTRASWSDAESHIIKLVEIEGASFGLLPYYDSVGNLYLRSGDKPRIVMTGSHADSVKNGGNYDGIAGIVAGLEAIRAILCTGINLNKSIELVAWRGEESDSFKVPYKGSSAAFGMLNPQILGNINNGRSLEEAIKIQGFDPAPIRDKVPALNQEHRDSIDSYVELHIEQGPILHLRNKDIGIVTAIRGNVRYLVEVFGEFNHSGATPMNLRHDANASFCELINKANELAKKLSSKRNYDIVFTSTMINRAPEGAALDEKLNLTGTTKISGYCAGLVDIRSMDFRNLQDYIERFHQLIDSLELKNRVEIKAKQQSFTDPIPSLDYNIQAKIEKSARKLGLKYQRMPSGAGHDAAVVAKYKRSGGTSIPVGMIFIPCANGYSHCPEEFASTSSLVNGANVLAHTLYRLAR